MKVRIAQLDPKADQLIPPNKDDDSGVGINYADAVLKPIKLTLDDGRKITCKRRGLKLTLKIGKETGEGLLRRLEHGPEVKEMFRKAMEEAAREAGAVFSEEDGHLCLELDEES